jgi:hypothetical protein
MELDAVGALESPGLDDDGLGRELIRLEIGHPQQIPRARAALDLRQAQGLRTVREGGLLEGEALGNELLVGQRVLDLPKRGECCGAADSPVSAAGSIEAKSPLWSASGRR